MGKNKFSMAFVGDAFISKRLSVFNDDERFSSMIKIIRDADVAFVNLETGIHHFEGFPLGEDKSDAYGQADPYVADELKWAGFDLVSRANNHTMDFSVGGMIATTSNLDRVGLTHAGAGINLGEAREPAYLETMRGVVSLISSSTGIGMKSSTLGLASHSRKELQGRPGVNPLRIEAVYNLDPKSFNALKNIVKKFNLLPLDIKEDVEEFSFPTQEYKFKLSKETNVARTINKSDFEGNIKAVTDARRLSDWVIYSLHDHTTALKLREGFKPREMAAEPVEEFAHACIDSGVDAFVGHGSHALRGLEIYKGKPIFYSLGNFVFQSTLIKRQPSDLFERWGLDINDTIGDLYEKREMLPAHFFDEIEYWESVIAGCTYDGEKLAQLKLHPITLGYDDKKTLREQRTKAGVPKLAEGVLGEKIIKNMNRLSSCYGTEIRYKDQLGIVKL